MPFSHVLKSFYRRWPSESESVSVPVQKCIRLQHIWNGVSSSGLLVFSITKRYFGDDRSDELSYSFLWFLFTANGVDHRFCQHHQPLTVPSVHSRATALQQKTEENKEQTLDKLALVEYIDKQGHYDDSLCNVFRSGINSKSKISSYGFLATFLNCSVLVGFTEQPCSEGSSYETCISQRSWFRSVRPFPQLVRRVLHHILTIRKFGHLPSAMCYDCACTLKLFIGKHFGTDDLKATENTQFLTSLSMAIDRFHVLNHKRAMCKTVMRPDHPCHKGVYESINTEVAEQLFSYLAKFKHSFRAYNYPKSTIFFTLLFHLKNCSTTGIQPFQQSV